MYIYFSFSLNSHLLPPLLTAALPTAVTPTPPSHFYYSKSYI